MGYCLALGALRRSLLRGHLRQVLDPLISCCSDISASEAKFAEARRDALRSITRYRIMMDEEFGLLKAALAFQDMLHCGRGNHGEWSGHGRGVM